MSDLMKLQNMNDFEEVAKTKLPSNAYDYYASGACDEITLRKNITEFQKIELWPKVLTDVTHIDLSTSILGTPISIPIIVAPMAVQKMAHPEGEIGMSRAVKTAGTIMTLSSISSTSIEVVAQTMDNHLPGQKMGGRWFQLYILKNRSITESLIKRAQNSGYSAIVLTVDCVVSGKRDALGRNKFMYPDDVKPENFVDFYEIERKNTSFPDMSTFISTLYDHSITWKDILWIKSITSLPIILKGILSPLDAKLAVNYGVSAIVVSNHGGRQVDTSPATITALPLIAKAVKGSGMEIILDGGIRRGTDIVKAIALGATCVMVGRPVLWGLATSGERGVNAVLNILSNELKNFMQNSGCNTLRDITPALLINYPHSQL